MGPDAKLNHRINLESWPVRPENIHRGSTQEGKDPPHTHRKLRTAGGPQNRVCRMWPMLWDESYRWADSTRDSAVCPHVALTWKACPSERRCMSLNVQGYGVLFMCVLVTQSCLTLCDPMDGSLPGSSVHGIFQARVLEWVAISFSREYKV